MKKFILPISIIISISFVLFLTNSFKEKTTLFLGIADNQEQAVSFQEAVKIIEINVIEGQFVERGMVLLRAERSSLAVEKNLLDSQLEELTAQQNESEVKINAEVSMLRGKETADLAIINLKVSELRSKQQLNIELYKNIMGSLPTTTTKAPLQVQINSLIKQKKIIKKSIQTQINSLLAKLNVAKEPITARKKRVSNSLHDINRQEDELIIKADFSGRIGNISHKRGERIPSFQSVLTVYGLYPKKVKGYIHENVSNDVRIGQQVWVHSLSNINKSFVTEGKVESLGSRIIEYPDRLRRNPMVKSWAREVNIRLPMNNTLLLGEKVQVSFSPQSLNSLEAFFKPVGGKTKTLFPRAYVDMTKRIE